MKGMGGTCGTQWWVEEMGASGFDGKIEGTRSLGGLRHGLEDHHHHHHYHISVMGLGHLLTRSGLTYLEVSSKVYHDSRGMPSSHKRGNDDRVTAL